MFKEAQLYAPVTTGADGAVTVHLDEDHPGFGDPEYRARRNQIAARALAVGARPADPARRLQRRRAAASGRRCGPSSRPSTSGWPAREYRDAMARLALPHDHVPQLDEVSARLRAADRISVSPGGGAGPVRGVLRVAGRRGLSLHPVHPPPRPPAVHAGTGPDPRGHRARRPAGEPAPGRAQPARRPGRPSPPDARPGATSSRRVFWFTIEFGVALRGRGAAGLRRRAAVVLR